MYNTTCISKWKMNRRLLICNFACAMLFYYEHHRILHVLTRRKQLLSLFYSFWME